MRLDQLLRFLRFARTRGAAQRWIGVGHIRRNGARVTRRDQPVAVGDVADPAAAQPGGGSALLLPPA